MALADGWLVAVVPGGLLCAADGGATIDVELDARQAAGLVAGLAVGADASALAHASGSAPAQIEELLATLTAEGALRDPLEPIPAAPLADAIGLVRAGRSIPSELATATELLAVPAGSSPEIARRALRAFVAGLPDHRRLRAYSHAAGGERSVLGDRPPDDAIAAARATLAELDPAAIHVVDLVAGGVQSVDPARLERLGASRVHRLGTVTAVDFPGPRPPGAPDVQVCMARQAVPNLAFPGDGHGYSVGVAATRADAELIARAEGAERFAAGDLAGRRLPRATEAELDAPILRPESVVRYSERQRAERWGGEYHDPADARLWVEGTTLAGARRWVAAEMAFSPFHDPDSPRRLPALTGSGTAAHRTRAEATERALAELVERDAFMWHWVQRVARERIDPASLSAALRRQIGDLAAAGHAVDLVDLTLDTWPVVFCAVRAHGILSVAAACRRDPAAAAAKALVEAAALLWSAPEAVPQPVARERVASPVEHLAFHRDPAHRREAEFLWSEGDSIALDDVRGGDEPLADALGRLAEPVVVDLTASSAHPFAVVRAFAPGLVPLSFGFDREPLGVPRLAAPLDLPDGRRLGARLDLARIGPIIPHPFP